uniref:Uncharacterized protein n=1 Tax=Cucumis melo TaxID=3656 RepID=A0A9I9DX18_CUCME
MTICDEKRCAKIYGGWRLTNGRLKGLCEKTKAQIFNGGRLSEGDDRNDDMRRRRARQRWVLSG